MKLQVALDFFKLEDAIALMCKIHPFVDIAEIGTPLVLSEGFRAVSVMKAMYPHIDILADMKLMDGGEPIASHAFDAERLHRARGCQSSERARQARVCRHHRRNGFGKAHTGA